MGYTSQISLATKAAPIFDCGFNYPVKIRIRLAIQIVEKTVNGLRYNDFASLAH